MFFREVKTYTHVCEISNLLEISYGKTKVNIRLKMFVGVHICYLKKKTTIHVIGK